MAGSGDITSTVATLHGEALNLNADSAANCQLVVIEGPDMGRAASIAAGEQTLVGTDEGCQLVLHDDRVSRKHLSVCLGEEGGFAVKDLDSRNRTLYAGSVIGEATLPVGATLKLGRTYLRIQPRPAAVEVPPSQSRRLGDLVAESLAMREVFAVLELAARSDITVMLEGETGTGKELAARAVHESSDRRRGPFVAVDCGALPDNLLESELFGHVQGAFTGARRDRKGAFARAHRGTVFLDELDSVPLAVQARLLRVVEERQVRPVGADAEQAVDVRILAASRAPLAARVAEGSFRPDLFYRLSVLHVTLPPLRDRREDIAPIVVELLRRRGFEAARAEGDNLHRLHAHNWPGNVRELRNVIDRAIALSPMAGDFSSLRVQLGPWSPGAEPGLTGARTDLPFSEAKQLVLAAFERRYLADVLARCDGNISATAREAGLDRKHLKTLLKRHGLL